MSPPIVISKSFARDGAVVRLITQWRNLLQDHAICRKRVRWTHPKASAIEKKRRRRRWELDDRIHEIEQQLLRWLAKETRHPDLYMPKMNQDPLDHTSYPRIYQLTLEYIAANKPPGPQNPQRNLIKRQRTQSRHSIVQAIRNLEWRWMVALFQAVYPTQPLPPRRPVDTRVLRPRRQVHASTR